MLFELEPRLVEAWEAPARMTLHTDRGPVEVNEGNWVIHAVTLKGEGATIERTFTVKTAEEWKQEHPKPYFGDMSSVPPAPTTGRRTTRTAKAHKTEIPTLTKTAQEALTVIAKAHKALNAKTLGREIGADPKSTKAALSELKSAGAIQHHGRGTWVAVNGARA